jgi:hypothetical protein
MYGIYADSWGILMVNDTIYSIHGSYGDAKSNVVIGYPPVNYSLALRIHMVFPRNDRLKKGGICP